VACGGAVDIGRIMANALGDLFNAGAKRAVISGVDIPGLERGIVGDAFSLLENCEVVIGPALDGGYYLIGMKSLHDEVFRRIPWSTARVFQETVETIGKLGLRYASVKPLSDVDRFEDLEKFPELDV
jgi:glycosyltransferase A (GT-A) superfamily protein (DUF2064 family)